MSLEGEHRLRQLTKHSLLEDGESPREAPAPYLPRQKRKRQAPDECADEGISFQLFQSFCDKQIEKMELRLQTAVQAREALSQEDVAFKFKSNKRQYKFNTGLQRTLLSALELTKAGTKPAVAEKLQSACRTSRTGINLSRSPIGRLPAGIRLRST